MPSTEVPPSVADEERTELKLVHLVPPVTLALAFGAYSTPFAPFFRTFFSQWMHELGHATTAWLAGYAAIPGPWRTLVPDERSLFVTVLLYSLLVYLAYRAYKAERFVVLVPVTLVAGLAAYLVSLRPYQAQTLITFGGDAGGMILSAVLMATFYVPPGHHLHKTWLRWGFVVIGALGFVDPFRTWWIARRDPSIIPYGEIEGVGDSDPVRLLASGWSEPRMISNFVAVGTMCLLALMVAHGLGVRAARRRVP